MTKNERLAWAAGLVDGEGCVYINRQRAANRKDLKRDSFRLYLKVTMGDWYTLDHLKSILGVGTIQDHIDRAKISDKVNSSWSYLVGARQAEQVLRRLRPFFVTKTDEVNVALEFLQLKSAPRGGGGGGKPTPDLLIEQRLLLYWRLRQLKPRWRFYKAGIDKDARKRRKRPEYVPYLGEG